MQRIVINDPTGEILVSISRDPEVVTWVSGFRIDGDGAGPSHGDPCFQGRVSLRHTPAINSDVDFFAAVPPQIVKQTSGIVMGCKGDVVNLSTGARHSFVVADEGPSDKIGEGSIALAKLIGVPWSPVYGGNDDHIFQWTIYPGIVAPGYQLQRS